MNTRKTKINLTIKCNPIGCPVGERSNRIRWNSLHVSPYSFTVLFRCIMIECTLTGNAPCIFAGIKMADINKFSYPFLDKQMSKIATHRNFYPVDQFWDSRTAYMRAR